MVVDAWASEVQYAHHLAPIWAELRDGERGSFHVSARIEQEARALLGDILIGAPPRTGGLILVASFQDSRRVAPRPVVYVEHGAGQTYLGLESHGSYAGGEGHDHAVLFLCPREQVADRWRKRYPRTPAVAVGSPRVDWLRKIVRAPSRLVISFHAELRMHDVPEVFSAWRHYAPAFPTLADMGVLGHAHPRALTRIGREYRKAGIEIDSYFAAVVLQSSVYACDNSSTLFEAAACDVPVVTLNAPWFRRDVKHGLRFWSEADVGVQIDDPADLADALAEQQGEAMRRRRAEVAEIVYGPADGRAAERAVEAIRSITRPT